LYIGVDISEEIFVPVLTVPFIWKNIFKTEKTSLRCDIAFVPVEQAMIRMRQPLL